jgi:hypothetical protein
MSRHPIGERAMTDAERHRRYMTRLRQRANAPPPPAPRPVVRVPPEERDLNLPVRTIHLAMNPVQVGRYLAAQLGPEKTRALRDVLDQWLIDWARDRKTEQATRVPERLD